MATLPEKFSNYTKFISFILKYWNSDVFKAASDNALNNENTDDSEHDYDNPQELAEDLKNMGDSMSKMNTTPADTSTLSTDTSR